MDQRTMPFPFGLIESGQFHIQSTKALRDPGLEYRVVSAGPCYADESVEGVGRAPVVRSEK